MQSWAGVPPVLPPDSCAALADESTRSCELISENGVSGLSCRFTGGDVARTLTIQYMCAPKMDSVVVREGSALQYILTLKGPAGCGKTPTPTQPAPAKITTVATTKTPRFTDGFAFPQMTSNLVVFAGYSGSSAETIEGFYPQTASSTTIVSTSAERKFSGFGTPSSSAFGTAFVGDLVASSASGIFVKEPTSSKITKIVETSASRCRRGRDRTVDLQPVAVRLLTRSPLAVGSRHVLLQLRDLTKHRSGGQRRFWRDARRSQGHLACSGPGRRRLGSGP